MFIVITEGNGLPTHELKRMNDVIDMVDFFIIREQFTNALIQSLSSFPKDKLIIHSNRDAAQALNVDRLHLKDRPIDASLTRDFILSQSIHDINGIHRAHKAGCQFVLYSPIFITSSKPDVTPKGINGLKDIMDQSPLDVVSLGGVNLNTIKQLKGISHHIAVKSFIFNATLQEVELLYERYTQL